MPSALSPVSSGSTRTIWPSLTCIRNGHREPQFTLQEDHTIVSAAPAAVGVTAFAGPTPGSSPKDAPVPTRAAPPPTMPDHLRNDRRGIPLVGGFSVVPAVMVFLSGFAMERSIAPVRSLHVGRD